MDDLISRKRALEEMTFSCGIEQDGVLYVPLRDVNKHLKSLPSEAYLQTIATKRYEDLCEYFGNQEYPILTDRREFKRWLDRVRWHVKKVDELTKRSEDEWCTECKEYDNEKHCCPRFNHVIRETVKEIRAERKSVIYYADGYSDGCMMYDTAECPSCGYMFDEDDSVWGEPFCPHCGQELEWVGEQDE